MEMSILAPAAVLVLWSLVMLGWTAFSRFPAMTKAGVDLGARPGGRGQDLEGILPGSVNWKSHNYSHLMEQPTIFYPTVFILFLAGAATPLTVGLAWAYVGLRIVHSVYQATINQVMVRFSIFALATLCLLFLAVHAVVATI